MIWKKLSSKVSTHFPGDVSGWRVCVEGVDEIRMIVADSNLLFLVFGREPDLESEKICLKNSNLTPFGTSG